VAVAGLSGHQPALGDPIFVAAVLGAQAPDFDIVALARGNMAFSGSTGAFLIRSPASPFGRRPSPGR
jgi:inner membrane protein